MKNGYTFPPCVAFHPWISIGLLRPTIASIDGTLKRKTRNYEMHVKKNTTTRYERWPCLSKNAILVSRNTRVMSRRKKNMLKNNVNYVERNKENKDHLLYHHHHHPIL